ncbi:MAG: hypothetical protein ABW321_15695 [Polyangiales bacterium]
MSTRQELGWRWVCTLWAAAVVGCGSGSTDAGSGASGSGAGAAATGPVTTAPTTAGAAASGGAAAAGTSGASGAAASSGAAAASSAAGGGGTAPITATPAAAGAGAGGTPVPGAGAAAPAAGSGGAAVASAGAEAPPATVDASAPLPSPGCMGGTFKAGHTDETISVGSRSRQYVQTVPSSYDGTQPFSVLLDFHGGTYDGKRWDARESNEFHDMAETERFIYITPTGLDQWWTTTEGVEGDDGQFMQALLDKLKTEACVDTRRIYATGCSMGGDMSFYMACYFSDQIAAVLPLCGSASFELESECKPKRPISMQFVIGSQDTLNCWEPPRTSVGNPCSTEVQAVFAQLNSCTGEAKKTHGGVCETHEQCAEGTEVSICMVDAQHTTIYTNPDIDIYADGWAFLKRFYIH